MTIIETIILAIVEGLTEFLPVSSTGHMVITQALLGMESTSFLKAFTVMIQFGAILSVVVLYWRRFINFSLPSEMWHGNHSGWRRALSRLRFYFKLAWGCLPAVMLGLLFNDWVDKMLDSVWVIALNLFFGGVIMLFIDKIIKGNSRHEVSYSNAFVIGLFQCIAIFLPGISRSMATIVGGMATGLTKKSAAEFSFFLAVPTMFGATLLEAYKLYRDQGLVIFETHWQSLVVGNVVSFIVALIAIRYFITFLSKHSFRAFGMYRIFIGMVIGGLLLLGIDLAVL